MQKQIHRSPNSSLTNVFYSKNKDAKKENRGDFTRITDMPRKVINGELGKDEQVYVFAYYGNNISRVKEPYTVNDLLKIDPFMDSISSVSNMRGNYTSKDYAVKLQRILDGKIKKYQTDSQ